MIPRKILRVVFSVGGGFVFAVADDGTLWHAVVTGAGVSKWTRQVSLPFREGDE